MTRSLRGVGRTNPPEKVTVPEQVQRQAKAHLQFILLAILTLALSASVGGPPLAAQITLALVLGYALGRA